MAKKKEDVKVEMEMKKTPKDVDPVSGKSLKVMGIVKKNKKDAGMCKE